LSNQAILSPIGKGKPRTEDDEGQEREDPAQVEHEGEGVWVEGADELRQKGQEENRQRRVERVVQRKSVTIAPEMRLSTR